MKAAFLRRVAVAMLAVLAFAQASTSLADCLQDRGTLRVGMTVGMAASSEPCRSPPAVSTFGPLYANRCLAHCASDLQVSPATLVLVSAPPNAVLCLVPAAFTPVVPRGSFRGGGPPKPPHRILLHSFLI